ncbi:MAG: hypothetical protein DRQ55_17060 [Planctomycetota bacterium]|nr:MAG: hypothetical protein DRQ55_17060 [Planctomycetota bacterium]
MSGSHCSCRVEFACKHAAATELHVPEQAGWYSASSDRDCPERVAA